MIMALARDSKPKYGITHALPL